jgi:hypothetical protein
MSERTTPPLPPPDCDLRGLPFMPLDVVRLTDSDLVALATGDEFKAAVLLWCKAWLQVPAASLPDDDRILAHLSGAGSRWTKLKAVALRGWVKCSDGRLYHPVIAEKAREAWSFRVRQREKSARANAARWASPRQSPDVSPRGSPQPPKGQGQGHSTEAPPLPVAVPSPAVQPPPDARAVLWTEGLARLRRITGKPDGAARGLLGKLCREARDDCALVGSLLHEAEAQRVGDPIPWLTAALQTRTGERVLRAPVNSRWQAQREAFEDAGLFTTEHMP